MALFHKMHPPRFDGYALQVGVEWSEQEDPWISVHGSTVLVPGWIDKEGVAVFDPDLLMEALAAEEARVAAYLEAQRTPAAMPEELATVVRKPMTLADLTERVAAARRANGGRDAPAGKG